MGCINELQSRFQEVLCVAVSMCSVCYEKMRIAEGWRDLQVQAYIENDILTLQYTFIFVALPKKIDVFQKLGMLVSIHLQMDKSFYFFFKIAFLQPADQSSLRENAWILSLCTSFKCVHSFIFSKWKVVLAVLRICI